MNGWKHIIVFFSPFPDTHALPQKAASEPGRSQPGLSQDCCQQRPEKSGPCGGRPGEAVAKNARSTQQLQWQQWRGWGGWRSLQPEHSGAQQTGLGSECLPNPQQQPGPGALRQLRPAGRHDTLSFLLPKPIHDKIWSEQEVPHWCSDNSSTKCYYDSVPSTTQQNLCGCLDRSPSSSMTAELETPPLPMVSSLNAPSPDPLPPPLPVPLNLTVSGNGQDTEEFVPVRTDGGNVGGLTAVFPVWLIQHI